MNRGHYLSEDGSENVTGGIQEVASIKGPVPSLSLEVVDLRQEGVDSYEENTGSAFTGVHRKVKVLTIGLAKSTE